MNDQEILERKNSIFKEDMDDRQGDLKSLLKSARVLVVGAAGTIGQSVCKQILYYNPEALHAVDLSENNMVELVRDIRSSFDSLNVDFRTFCIDIGSIEFSRFFEAHGPYDYVYNLSALKHVRSERDPFTLMRMIKTNVINSIKLYQLSKNAGTKKYFCVSTDKAANPKNSMGATKLIMEQCLMGIRSKCEVSMARFANVVFSDGSLLAGFNNRFQKMQPIAAPNDIKRYFVSRVESGELCTLSGTLGKNADIFFPKNFNADNAIDFASLAKKFLKRRGFEPLECASEEESRMRASEILQTKKWPVYFFKSDTTGEKDLEEFYTKKERIDWKIFKSIAIVKCSNKLLDYEKFILDFNKLMEKPLWTREEIVEFLKSKLPDFNPIETGKFLDSKM